MPKIKTIKAATKRVSITKKKKLKQQKAGRDHFNARESGNTGRKKRRDIDTPVTSYKTFRTLIQK